ncbi:hypothetical protein C8R44DRAFT_738872 [Mycena epipterygia]|nr:hypothetical protein C8R44DRAFT_738872 [Mycena epipterygia]
MTTPKAKTTPPTASKTEAPGRTKEEKKQRGNDRKRERQDPHVPFPHLNPIRPSAPPSVAPIPYIPQFVFNHYRQLLDDHEEYFIASNDADDTLEGLLSLALQIGWQIGWEHGRESGISSGKKDGRHEGITEGRHLGLEEATQLPPIESLPLLTVTVDAITPPVVPIPRDFTALQTGSPHPFGTLQRRLARSRRPQHAQKKSIPVPTHPIITRQHPQGISNNKPISTTPVLLPPHPRRGRQRRVLDWDHDPLLSDLGRALGALGWIRGG